jgi:hypothetical protein
MSVSRFDVIFGAGLLLLFAGGCRTVGGAMEAGGRATRGVVGSVEPTGVVAETEERRKLWEATRERIEGLELDKVNAAINDLADGVAKLTERIEALRTEDITTVAEQLVSATTSLRQQIEAADLPRLVEGIHTMIGTVDTEVVGKVNVDEINALVTDVRATSAQLRESVFRLESSLAGLMTDVQTLTRNVNRVVEVVPTEQVERTLATVDETTLMIRSSTANLPSTMAQIDETLGLLRWLTRVLLVVAITFGLGACAWFVRLVRPAHGRAIKGAS